VRTVPAGLRRLVIQRAAHRCEYCKLSQEGQEATFHIDHVIPVAAGGETVAENLALTCVSCSLRKAARQTAVDPQSGQEVALYNPRRDVWHEHFRKATMLGLVRTLENAGLIQPGPFGNGFLLTPKGSVYHTY